MTESQFGIITISDEEFQFVKSLMYKETGIFLADHKKIMVQSRLNGRAKHFGLKSVSEYIGRLRADHGFFNSELTELINRITTNKTDFFRENHHFEFLKDTFFPSLEEKAAKNGKKILRIWSSACSTGEEPYTLAITCLEYFAHKSGWDIKIYASDIDTNVINTAKEGIYKEDRLLPVDDKLKNKYFTKLKDPERGELSYQAKQQLKDLIDFRKVNLLETPYPIPEKMDCVFCRNVIIYFDKQTQKKIFENFEVVLKDRGLLVIGHSETLFGISDSYKFLGHTVYQKKPVI
ncbi:MULTISPECIES: protein-glutamate O-methyltransferase CheR [Leptospira]|uniref:protein-glutamate O-methyltransferase n=3 Tax=Leptospira weilii TaxID=28184 RepID=N1U8H0_9LEPT|nr:MULTISPECIES: protein-glutamate O-methyltransferase CheR [Leptospira]EMY15387.1 protein-glutamate O-methyltransferase CheR [Leptospira weilii str. Ecochallenge]EMN46194.1 protein-glutamate O-methyltransferase CheR [Leptospira weilii str. LNT 1234]EMN90234.1 protein-glutamate O-methyltransferase CheR [Leptospira weilii str. UI 13098]OMI18692.1 SAM-dependent methyltransferase [Leptospira weilii serovar Heyan]QDK24057.1 protein-glutamate O-methyltransferase CheR [Leptospira weilii]